MKVLWIFLLVISLPILAATELIPVDHQLIIKQTGIYSHQLPVSVYLTHEDQSLQFVGKHLNRAQSDLDLCGIALKLEQVFKVNSELNLWDWETFDFEGGLVTEMERELFDLANPDEARLIFVNAVDWSYNPEGITGMSYPPFAISEMVEESGRRYYRERMVGSAILTPYLGGWTLVHEIGHAVFNLHHHDDPGNIMFPSKVKYNPVFTEQQCQVAREAWLVRSL